MRAAGFRLDVIYPADEPQAALLSHDGQELRLTAPGAPQIPQGLPDFQPEFVLTSSGGAPGQGRAGMLYRDLVPSRLGGRYIASHITIVEGGPVDDWVHYHRVALQLIYVRRGWVRVVYQDQGEAFVLRQGDFVLQPPGIRHRVIESSPGLEVIELSAPALHETFDDHDLELPNGDGPGGLFEGQAFLRHVAVEKPWTPFAGAEAQESALETATGGLAQMRTIRAGGAAEIAFAAHDGELMFGFVLEGAARLNGIEIAACDAFVIPPGDRWTLGAMSGDFRLLQVATALLDAPARCPL